LKYEDKILLSLKSEHPVPTPRPQEPIVLHREDPHASQTDEDFHMEESVLQATTCQALVLISVSPKLFQRYYSIWKAAISGLDVSDGKSVECINLTSPVKFSLQFFL